MIWDYVPIAPMTICYNRSLDFNQLNGIIPSTIGALTTLEILYEWKETFVEQSLFVWIFVVDYSLFRSLYHNQLTGFIPSTIGLISSLGRLYVYSFVFLMNSLLRRYTVLLWMNKFFFISFQWFTVSLVPKELILVMLINDMQGSLF